MLPNIKSANTGSEWCPFFLSLLRCREKAIVNRAVWILSARVPKIFDRGYDIRRPQRDIAARGLDLSRCGRLVRYYVEILRAFDEQKIAGQKLQPRMHRMPELRDKAMDGVICTAPGISSQSRFSFILHSV